MKDTQSKDLSYTEIHMELTTHCNFRCFFCPINKLTRSDLSMPKNEALQIISEIAEEKLSNRVAYHLMGEPLLHPDLKDILKYSSERKITNRVVTNGALLANERFVAKLEYCDVLDISLRAKSQEEFKKICHNEKYSYEQYLSNIKTFLAQRMNTPMKKIRLRLFMSKHIDQIVKSVGLDIKPLTSKNSIQYDDKLEILLDNCLKWGGSTKYPVKFFGACEEFETGFSILVNGNITTCCWDYDGKNTLGNIFKEGSIKNILYNEKADRFRRMFSAKRVPTKACASCLARPTLLRCIAYQSKQIAKSFI